MRQNRCWSRKLPQLHSDFVQRYHEEGPPQSQNSEHCCRVCCGRWVFLGVSCFGLPALRKWANPNYVLPNEVGLNALAVHSSLSNLCPLPCTLHLRVSRFGGNAAARDINFLIRDYFSSEDIWKIIQKTVMTWLQVPGPGGNHLRRSSHGRFFVIQVLHESCFNFALLCLQ